VLVEGLEERPEPWPVTGLGVPGQPRLPEASVLFQDLERRAVRPPNSEPPPPENLKLRVPNGDQLTWARIDLEELIPGDHKARAIWHLTGQLDLTRFREGLCTVKGNLRRQAAQRRAAREREARLEQALAELQAIQAQKQSEQEKQEARVSLTDPEARIP
jgi:hypothetical protein